MVRPILIASLVIAACGSQPVIRGEPAPVPRGSGLRAVMAPAGERIAPPGGQAPELPWGADGLGLPGHKIDLSDGEDTFMRATPALADSAVAWEIADSPSAGGSEFILSGEPDWHVFFMTQSRIGTWVLETTTGKQIDGGPIPGMDGYQEPVIAPDRTWALLAPWYSDFGNCFPQDLPLRVALTSAVGGHPIQAATPIPLVRTCGRIEPPELAATAVAISPAGDLYAYVYRDDHEGRIEVFRARDDQRVAVLENGIPPFEQMAFSTSGKYLVLLSHAGDEHDVATWYQVDLH